MPQQKKTSAIKTTIQDLPNFKLNALPVWKKQIINITQRFLKKVTNLPIKLSISKEQVMVNACVLFWYQEGETKNFVMLKSHFSQNQDTIIQFPFAACYGSESASNIMQETTKDLFGSVFVKTLALDCFAPDRVASCPTVVINNENNIMQSVLHNLVWVSQITPEQADLIKDSNDKFDIIHVPEYQLQDHSVHEVHRFIYQSCLRHVHNKHSTDFFTYNDFPEDTTSKGKILH